MTGCGTSGRIAFQTARRYNRVLCAAGVRPLFHYLISGGDSALLLSDELPEDDPVEGARDLDRVVKEYGSDGTFLIGVTCGLSAPYVAGQLHYALQDSTRTVGAAVMGFNPVELSRDAAIEKAEGNWTFRDVARNVEKESHVDNSTRRFAVLNPVIGPEPIAGIAFLTYIYAYMLRCRSKFNNLNSLVFCILRFFSHEGRICHCCPAGCFMSADSSAGTG